MTIFLTKFYNLTVCNMTIWNFFLIKVNLDSICGPTICRHIWVNFLLSYLSIRIKLTKICVILCILSKFTKIWYFNKSISGENRGTIVVLFIWISFMILDKVCWQTVGPLIKVPLCNVMFPRLTWFRYNFCDIYKKQAWFYSFPQNWQKSDILTNLFRPIIEVRKHFYLQSISCLTPSPPVNTPP